MKRKFTFLIAAAFMLLTMMATTGRMWGQTKTEGDTHDFSQSLQQLLNNNASIASIEIDQQSYSVKKVTISYRYNKTITNAVTMEVFVNGTSWGTQYSTGTGSNYTTIDFQGESATGPIVISFTNNTGSGTGHGTFYVNNVRLTEGASGGGSDPSITAANVDLEYNETSKSIMYEIENYEEGEMTASTTADWISDFTYEQEDEIGEVGFTTTVNESISPRSATVTLTYTYGTKSTVNKNVTVTQAGNPNAPGSQNNPYTVAEARAAIDAGIGTQGVYATGIVYQVDSYNSNYHSITYWISDDGTSTNPLEVYGGLGIDDETNQFTSKDDIQVNDIVVVCGNLTKFNTTYEFAQNNRLISLVRKVATPTFYPVAGAVAQNTEITISCATNGATIYYTTDGTDPSTSSTQYNAQSKPTITAATTIKAIAVKDGYTDSDIASAEYTILVPAATPTFSPGTGTYTWAQDVTISTTTDGATIYYTTNGDYPTTGSTQYTGAIAVSETKTIKAIAVKAGMANSAVGEATYTMNIPAINAENVNIAYNATSGELEYTITNPVEGGAITNAEVTASTPNGWLTVNGSNPYNSPISLTCEANETTTAHTAIVTLTYTYNTDKTVTKAVTVTQSGIDYATLPFAFDSGSADIANTVGLTQYGLGSDYNNKPYLKFDSTGDWVILKINERPGVLSFDIKGNGFSSGSTSTFKVQASTDGTNYSDLATYTELGETSNKVFENLDANVRYIKWIYTEKGASSGGNVALGNIALAAYNYTPSITINPGPYNMNCDGGHAVLDVAYANMAQDPQLAVIFYESNGTTPATYNHDWIDAHIDNDGNLDGTIQLNTTNEARSAYFKIKGVGANSNNVYSELVTINQAAYVKSIVFQQASIDLAAGGESDRKISFDYSGLGNNPTFEVRRYESDGTTPATYDWLTTSINKNKVSITVSANAGDARHAYFKVYGAGSYANTESDLVTINQAAQPITYELVTNVNQIVSGKHYIIASGTSGDVKAMGKDKGNNRHAVAATVNENIIQSVEGIYEFVINDSGENWTIYDKNAPGLNTDDTYGFLYAAGANSNNYLKTRTTNTDNKGVWTISIAAQTNVATIRALSSGRNLMQYNSGSTIFSCYGSAQQDIYLYVKVNDNDLEFYGNTTYAGTSIPAGQTLTVGDGSVMSITSNSFTNNDPDAIIIEDGGQVIVNNAGVQATFKKSVAHSAAKTDPAENWYTISSPVNNIEPGNVTNLIQAEPTNYDLYYYDEVNQMWRNHKANAFANLTNGKGYLYWNSTGAELAFPGELNSGNVNVDVTVTGTGGPAGFNLIGNPYSHNIYKGTSNCAILNSQSKAQLAPGFYRLSDGGSWDATLDIIDDGTAIKPGEGILVKATTAGVVTITNTASAPSSKANNDFIKFMVSNSQYEDVAYALFDDATGLNKINHRNAAIPMLYIPQDGENFAIATMSDDTKTFGLNLKAMTTGKYTLSAKANGNFSYLHIIDRLTGEDVDMLLEGEYSFIASPQDTDARFIVKLRYNANGTATSGDIFAYQNGSDIVVNGEGELQVFDVMGRLIATQHINGVQTVNVNANGVYIFKLNEKTQKIVVR